VDVSVTSNAGEIAAKLNARAAALRDVRPVLLGIAGDIDLKTAEAFTNSKRVDGLPFAELAESTKIGRLRRRKGKWRKAQGGKDATPEQRQAAIASAVKAAKFRPLIDTGRMRNSARARVVSNTTVRWSVVDYGVPHITGGRGGRPPQRNPSVFRVINGRWEIYADFAASITERIRRHVNLQNAGMT
jgi:phage gpG-like protein